MDFQSKRNWQKKYCKKNYFKNSIEFFVIIFIKMSLVLLQIFFWDKNPD